MSPAICMAFCATSSRLRPGMSYNCFCGSHGVISAAADTDNAVIRFHYFSGSGDDQRGFFVSHNHKSLQLAQVFVHSPVFGQLYGSPFKLAGMFFQFGFQAFD